jgi:hypothetical protein
VEDKRHPWGRSFLKRGELGGWDLWCLWEFVVHSNGQCDQRSVSTKLFRIHNLKTKQKLLLSSFFSHILSPFCTLPIHILDEERERERERALPKQFQTLLVQTNQRRSSFFFLVFEINSLAIITLCKSKWLVFRASKSKLSPRLENQSKLVSNYVVTAGT